MDLVTRAVIGNDLAALKAVYAENAYPNA